MSATPPGQPPQESGQTFNLNRGHTWKAPAGYRIVVLENGLVSFNVPEQWSIVQAASGFEMHLGTPPNVESRLRCSYRRVTAEAEQTAPSLESILMETVNKSTPTDPNAPTQIVAQTELVNAPREDLEVAWVERQIMNTIKHRLACSRMLMARGWGVISFLSLEYWEDASAQFVPVWEELVRSLELGRQIDDLLKGQTLQ